MPINRTPELVKHLNDLASCQKAPKGYEGTGYILDDKFYYHVALPEKLDNFSLDYVIEEIFGLHNKALLIRIKVSPVVKYELPYSGGRKTLPPFTYESIKFIDDLAREQFKEHLTTAVILLHDYDDLTLEDITDFDDCSLEIQSSKYFIDTSTSELRAPKKFATGVIV